uniref:Uncharacterized protein n=1 Tax=Physcomitrium patens TaxID=3218 RepID=A0A2K1KKI5_PHYPA|nr:hypothetical protein PHYPA_007967 [Physcomitrium patens]
MVHQIITVAGSVTVHLHSIPANRSALASSAMRQQLLGWIKTLGIQDHVGYDHFISCLTSVSIMIETVKLYPKAAYHGDWILSDAPCSLTLKLKALMSHEDEKSEISGDVQLVGKTALSVPAHLFRLSGHAIHFRGAGICHLFVLIAETMAATSLKIFSHAHPSQELNGGRV